MGLLDMPLLYLGLQAADDLRGGVDADIPHNEDLLQLLIEIIIDCGKAAEHGIDSPDDIVPGLRQALLQSGKKALFSLCHASSHSFPHSIVHIIILPYLRTDCNSHAVSSLSIRFTLTNVDTPFSCMVMP